MQFKSVTYSAIKNFWCTYVYGGGGGGTIENNKW